MTLRLSILCALLLTVPAMAQWIEFTSPSTNFAVSYCTNLSAPDWRPWLFGNKSILVASSTIDALCPRTVSYCQPLWWHFDSEPAPGYSVGIFYGQLDWCNTNLHVVEDDLPLLEAHQ